MDLFKNDTPAIQEILPDVWLLKSFALANEAMIEQDLESVISQAPLRHMMTPIGFAMSAAMTNCGDLGWVSDRKGYRYDAKDPNTAKLWPAMPDSFLALAKQAALTAGFKDFVPDACLINQYKVNASMGLHQDKNEVDFNQPIVSVSLGLPAIFLFGGLLRSDKPHKVSLAHGDVLVWGGKSRLNFHGIMPVKASQIAVLNTQSNQYLKNHRVNLTLRKAG
ncbi:MAG: DNA oxidative demethylase AlkB [Pseudomonadota bacterium]